MQGANEIVETEQDIIDAFGLFEDWTERYQYIIDLGRKLPEFPDDWKTEENRLHGCQSQVWMVPEHTGERLKFHATSDSAIVSGLIALLLKVYSDRRPEDIVNTPPEFVSAIELDKHLSPTRSNGLGAMIQKIRQLATEAAAA